MLTENSYVLNMHCAFAVGSRTSKAVLLLQLMIRQVNQGELTSDPTRHRQIQTISGIVFPQERARDLQKQSLC